MPVNVTNGENSLSGKITNLSDSGAALEFMPELGKKEVAFEIGNSVEIDSEETHKVPGSVVRQYEGGIAMQFQKDDTDVLEHITQIVEEEAAKTK